MAAYVAEAIHINDLETLFTCFWDAKSCCEIPEPLFATSDINFFDPSEQWGPTAYRAFVNITMGDMEELQCGYAAEAVKQTLPITFDIWTLREGCVEGCVSGGTGRQYMHDVKQEMRRIAFVHKHSLTNWQRIIYNGFKEVYCDSIARRFHGQMTWTLCNAGVNTDTEEFDNDLFNRSNGAIGSEWCCITGTWCVISNEARLSTCTVDAISNFIGAGCTWPTSVRVNVDITTVACIDAGIVFRYQNACNYWKATLEEATCIRRVRLSNIASGTEILIGCVREYCCGSPGWTAGQVRMLEVELYRCSILISVNGLTAIHANSIVGQTQRVYGLYSNSCTSVRFDCFRLNASGGSGR